MNNLYMFTLLIYKGQSFFAIHLKKLKCKIKIQEANVGFKPIRDSPTNFALSNHIFVAHLYLMRQSPYMKIYSLVSSHILFLFTLESTILLTNISYTYP